MAGAAKITTLKDAAQKLVEQTLSPQPQANANDPVRIAFVPFSSAVNVGTTYATAAWMDTTGVSPMHHDDFDWKSYGMLGAVKLPDGSWRRLGVTPAYPVHAIRRDEGPRRRNMGLGRVRRVASRGPCSDRRRSLKKDPATLFIPLFAPSESTWKDDENPVKNDYIPDTNMEKGNNEKGALERQRDVEKYFTNKTLNLNAKGPNFLCKSDPLTPLSSSRPSVLAAVSSMQAAGSTNIAEGLGWGWRVLTSGEPFTEGRPRNTKENLKVLVLMTDGENTYNPAASNGQQIEIISAGRSQFGTYGYAQIVSTRASSGPATCSTRRKRLRPRPRSRTSSRRWMRR